MIDMINQHVIPAVTEAKTGPCSDELLKCVKQLKADVEAIHVSNDDKEKATLSRKLRLETMVNARSVCDKAEAVCPAKLWTLPTYTDLLFLDAST